MQPTPHRAEREEEHADVTMTVALVAPRSAATERQGEDEVDRAAGHYDAQQAPGEPRAPTPLRHSPQPARPFAILHWRSPKAFVSSRRHRGGASTLLARVPRTDGVRAAPWSGPLHPGKLGTWG